MIIASQGRQSAFRFVCPSAAGLAKSRYLGYAIPEASATLTSLRITWLCLLIALITLSMSTRGLPVLYFVLLSQLVHGGCKVVRLRKVVRDGHGAFEIRPIHRSMHLERRLYVSSILATSTFLLKLDEQHSALWAALSLGVLALVTLSWCVDRINRGKLGLAAFE